MSAPIVESYGHPIGLGPQGTHYAHHHHYNQGLHQYLAPSNIPTIPAAPHMNTAHAQSHANTNNSQFRRLTLHQQPSHLQPQHPSNPPPNQPNQFHLPLPQGRPQSQSQPQPPHNPSSRLSHFTFNNTVSPPPIQKPPSPPALQRISSANLASASLTASPVSLAPSSTMYANNNSRRTPSNVSSSSTSSPQSSVRRSSSSRSSQPTSYVALLRKQKATVWCDRSQAEDPRILAAQRLAKERAEREVALLPGQHSGHGVGTARRTPPNSTAGSFTSGVARKIRHHGAQKATTYAGNLVGAGVPLRLSASEVDDDDEEEGAGERLGSLGKNPIDDDWDAQFYGTGRSGLPGHGRTASGNSRRDTLTPTGESMGALAEETPIAQRNVAGDYFAGKRNGSDPSSPEDEEEREKKEDELRRRGSVDDRAMPMGGVRLFVANPDSDDD